MVTVRCTRTTMADGLALYRLMTWLSPSYPVGAYTYSHGLEWSVEAGWVTSAETAQGWIGDVVAHGAGFSDTVFLIEAMRDDPRPVAEFAAAFVGTPELALESHAQGQAFSRISQDTWPSPDLDGLIERWDGPFAYPIVVGCVAKSHDLAEADVALAYLHAFTANLVSAAIRLVPLGQTDGQRIIAALEPIVADTVQRALTTPFEQATNTSLMTDICSMRHETQHTRLFRS